MFTSRDWKHVAGRAAAVVAVVFTLFVRVPAGRLAQASSLTGASRAPNHVAELMRHVVIRRDQFDVPHILADTEEAAALGHGFAAAEDHGATMARLFLRAQGRQAAEFGEGSAEQDFLIHRLGIVETADTGFAELPRDMRAILDGYALGYNLFLSGHRAEFPAWAKPITGRDVLAHALTVMLVDFALDLRGWQQPREPRGSNMWAIGRGLSKSGHGMLLANPHLGWQGAYLFHEVQLTVPGVINVNGAALIGLPVVAIGFNDYLGWSHTVNELDADDLYELTLDAGHANYLFDGQWLPLRKKTVVLEIKTDSGTRREQRTVLFSHHGPVVRIAGDKAYAFKSANLAVVNFLTEYNRMAKATSLAAFRNAIDMQQLPMFNIAYADREGNVWYLFNGRIPIRPPGFDWSGIVPGNTTRTEWSAVHPVADLPQILNPRTGYVQNCNDAPWYANLEQRIASEPFAQYLPAGGLGWRSQLSLQILSHAHDVTLEQLKMLKNNTHLVAADRVKDELVTLARSREDEDWNEAARVLEEWDNNVDAGSRGAVLFLTWWEDYTDRVSKPFRVPWMSADPIRTPSGLNDRAVAIAALDRAITTVKLSYGSLDVAWGAIHRFRSGTIDLPAGGDGSTFTNIIYRREPHGRYVAVSGDSYILTVEFTKPPRAYSVLTYSESSDSRSPYFVSQLPLYASGQMKPAWFSEADIAAHVQRRYHPEGTAGISENQRER